MASIYDALMGALSGAGGTLAGERQREDRTRQQADTDRRSAQEDRRAAIAEQQLEQATEEMRLRAEDAKQRRLAYERSLKGPSKAALAALDKLARGDRSALDDPTLDGYDIKFILENLTGAQEGVPISEFVQQREVVPDVPTTYVQPTAEFMPSDAGTQFARPVTPMGFERRPETGIDVGAPTMATPTPGAGMDFPGAKARPATFADVPGRPGGLLSETAGMTPDRLKFVQPALAQQGITVPGQVPFQPPAPPDMATTPDMAPPLAGMDALTAAPNSPWASQDWVDQNIPALRPENPLPLEFDFSKVPVGRVDEAKKYMDVIDPPTTASVPVPGGQPILVSGPKSQMPKLIAAAQGKGKAEYVDPLKAIQITKIEREIENLVKQGLLLEAQIENYQSIAKFRDGAQTQEILQKIRGMKIDELLDNARIANVKADTQGKLLEIRLAPALSQSLIIYRKAQASAALERAHKAGQVNSDELKSLKLAYDLAEDEYARVAGKLKGATHSEKAALAQDVQNAEDAVNKAAEAINTYLQRPAGTATPAPTGTSAGTLGPAAQKIVGIIQSAPSFATMSWDTIKGVLQKQYKIGDVNELAAIRATLGK